MVRRSRFRKFARGVVKYGPKVARVASTAYKTAMAVASLVNAEYKYTDFTHNTTLGTSISTTCLTTMAQGNTDITRNGDSIMMKYNYLKGYCVYNSAANASQRIRVCIVRDMNNSTTAPTLAKLFATTGAGLVEVAPHNKDYTEQYKVLYDKLFYVDASRPVAHFKYYKKFLMGKDKQGRPIKSAHCTFSGAADTDLGKGHLWLCQFSSHGLNSPTVVWYNRFGYVDN